MELKLEKITASNTLEVIAFLCKYEDTAVFLLGNLHEHGPQLGPHVNSGNFKLIRQNGRIVCVFCLTRRGNILVQSEVLQPAFELLAVSCQEEPFAIKGVIGDWNFAKAFWEYLKENDIIKKENFHSKEINYTLILDDRACLGDQKARTLQAEDYLPWKALRKNYLIEQKLPHDLSDEEMQAEYMSRCKKSMIWGLFVKSELIAIANLNAKTDRLATVGGVYTLPQWRRKGFGKALMEQLILDCKNQLSLHKLIIFTGESENKPAQKLYESLGCRKADYMALFFGE